MVKINEDFVKQLITLLLILMTSGTAFLAADDSESGCGTLIVSYQTDTKGERLDRVRFLIRDEQFQQQMYPKGLAYIDDVAGHTRIVIIEDLIPGEYVMEFVVPNHDGIFEEAPLRHFSITDNKIVKIDQIIKPKYVAQTSAKEALKGNFTLPPILSVNSNFVSEKLLLTSNTSQRVLNLSNSSKLPFSR
jgi:hypothetical protein